MGKGRLRLLLSIGAIEFFISSAVILLIERDAKNNALLGYSLGRWLTFFLVLFPGVILTFLAFLKRPSKFSLLVNNFFAKNIKPWMFGSLILLIVDLVIAIIPGEMLQENQYYFERIRPLLIPYLTFPFLIGVNWYDFKSSEIKPTKNSLSLWFLIMLLLLALWGFIVGTRIGLTPDIFYWNVVGIPITSIQFLLIIALGLILIGVIQLISNHFPKIKLSRIDKVVVLLLLIITVSLWHFTPMVKHYFSLQPDYPSFQPFPYSDARVHDLGAISIINGWGIYFGDYTDKPLYMSILAVFHLISGYDYNRMGFFQILVLASIVPILYIFGMEFHSRFIGILLSVVIMIRQQNAIILSHKVASVNPKLLVTEVITMLGIIVLCLVIHKLVKSQDKKVSNAFIAGGVLGAVSLLRMNPLLLFPIIIFFFVIIFFKKKELMKIIFSFVLGFGILVTPWVITGTDANGIPYLYIKFIDVINSRYSSHDYENSDNLIFYSNNHSKDLKISSLDQILDSSDDDNGVGLGQFPGFIINHFFHNMVTSFLALPTTYAPEDQILSSLAQREYFDDTLVQEWSGELDWFQIPIVAINLVIFNAGITVSRKKWGWGGIFPLFVYFGYLLSLGFARNSGSRYIVPVDWIIYFYFLIGIGSILIFMNPDLKRLLVPNVSEKENLVEKKQKGNDYRWWDIVLVVIMASIVPVAGNAVQIKSDLCEKVPEDYSVQFENNEGYAGPAGQTILGQVLYPQYTEDGTNFTLLTCRDYHEVILSSPSFEIESEDLVIAVEQGEEILILNKVNE